MATWDDVRRIALGLPGTSERPSRDHAHWWVGDKGREKGFVWERPLRSTDLAALGPAAPEGPVLGVRVPDLGVKAALLEQGGDVYFTTPHFHGCPAVLVQLDHIGVEELTELVTEAWLDRAPKKLVREFLAGPPGLGD